MDLLDELWSLIFREHLDFLDTVQCRRVSKRFKFLIDRLRPSELFVYGSQVSSLYRTYRDDRDPAMWIQLRRFYFEANSSFQILFVNLRFLQLDIEIGIFGIYDYKKQFNLELLNEFVRLEKLYLNTVVISRSRTLRLPELKVLSINLNSRNEYKESPARPERINYNREPRLTIDCKVETLLGARPTLMVINHPECVQHLATSYWTRKVLMGKELRRFKNLRVLSTQITTALLDAFPIFEHLQELHLDCVFHDLHVKEQLLDLLRKRSEWKRTELKVYICDLLVDPNFDPSEQLICCPRLWEKIANYHRLPDRVRHVFQIDYHVLGCFLTHFSAGFSRSGIALERGLPTNFFEKFPNIKTIEIYQSEIGNEEQFAWLLSKCTRLIVLRFLRRYLSQSLLNCLPVVSRNLKELYVSGYRNDATPLDLSPLYELRLLFALEIDSDDAGPNSAFDVNILLENCCYLTQINLKHIQILNDRVGFYRVFVKKEPVLSSELMEVGCYSLKELRSNL